MKVKAKDLKLADIVRTHADTNYGTATVSRVTDEEVFLVRPFIHTGDFEHTGGVLWYIGIEEYHIQRDNREVDVLERKELK